MKDRIDFDTWESDDHKFNIVFNGSITGADSPEELAEYVKQEILKLF